MQQNEFIILYLILKMFFMKKINLKGILEVLSEKELKNVLGGSGGACHTCSRQTCTTPAGFNNGKCTSVSTGCQCVA
jgi:bacteriocin-like protein